MMTGKMNKNFLEIFQNQMAIQDYLLKSNGYKDLIKDNSITVPFDCPELFAHHTLWLFSELGEVLQADKRWKSSRNNEYNKENKLEEIADCFIILMNVCLFSGFDYEIIGKAIVEKQIKVIDRLSK